jgi:SRSO17 transposase
MTKRQYIEYLVATPGNYTCTNLADHLEGEQSVSHDAISDFLRREKITPRRLWEVVAPLLTDSPDADLVVDDSVQDKRYSKKIELVKRQYSGAAGGLVDGIGVVNLLHSDGQEFYPIDFRVYSPGSDGKTKNEHFIEMLLRAKADKRLKASTVLFDAWYASVGNLKVIHRLGMAFVTTLKSNRLVSPSKEAGYTHLDALTWDRGSLEHGQLVKLKELPFLVRLFKLVAQNGDIEWAITNRGLDPDGGEAQARLTAGDVQDENAVRWQIEQLHRELKQLVGTERCQCRKARSQRNHLALCYLAWLSLKAHAKKFCITLYAARTNLFRDYLRAELRKSTIQAHCA